MMKRIAMLMGGAILSCGVAFAQTSVTGKVTSSDDGEPVVGASVRIIGSKTGTVTDIDGNFSLNVPADAKLEISYIGMNPQTVKASSNMKIVLTSDNKALDEVVVTGYGNFKKSSFTGSASTLSTETLQDVPTVSLEDKLAGGVPGVSMSNASGAPGAVNNIRIRGMGSINAGNEPLFVIDGVPVQSGNLSGFNTPGASNSYNDAGTNVLATLNSNDIESMTVIKDAAAASLYGSRAANGVIVITTKRGSQGKTKINFRSDWGFSNMAIDYRPQLNGDDRRALLWTGLKNYGLYNQELSEADATAFADSKIDQFASKPEAGWTDWKDILFRNGSHQNYEVSLNGGSQNTKFYSSISYTKQQGILYNQGLERFTGNANVTHTFGHFTVNASTLFSKMTQNLSNEGTSYDGTIANYVAWQSPSTTPYNEDGSLNDGSGMFGVNPVFERAHSYDRNYVTRSYNTLSLTYNIWDGLNFTEKLAYDYIGNTEDVLWDKESNNGSPAGVMQRMIFENTQLNTQSQLSYIKSFGKHNVDALLGFETEDYKQNYNYIAGDTYPGKLYEFANASNTSAESLKQSYRMTSWLGRVNYNYDNKYYLGVSYRRDGSSRLARKNRWGNFWSVSGSWRFTDEEFLKSITDVLNDGKIRLSYGVNGTQPSDYYAYMNVYKYGLKYNGEGGMGIVGVGNPDLKWEKNKAFNLGFDLQFINRITVTFDYYTRKTSDLIYDLPVSAIPGYYDGSTYKPTAPQNIGSLENKGFELTVQSVNFKTKDFDWTTTLNMGHNSNKVSKLNGTDNEIIDGVLIHRVGQPYYSYYAYEYAGVDPQTGKELYYINDGTENARKTTTNAAEAKKVIIGKHQTSIEGGLTNNLRWKFIDLGFTFTYALGGDAYDYTSFMHSNGGKYVYNGATPAYYKLSDMWTGPGDTSAKLPKFEYGSAAVHSSRWLMPMDYLRLKNLTLGFSVPRNIVAKAGLDKVRVYFSASNLLTWKSNDLLVDPEMPVNGLCTLQTPSLRTFTFGIDLGF